jgi:hypothetical protein
MVPLKLAALDAEDLAVISAHMQDACVRIGDLQYLPDLRKFALLANRFDWEAAANGGHYARRRTGLQFARVTAVRSKRIRREAEDAVLCLLSITFVPGDAPSGTVRLSFSGGGGIGLDVECLEASLTDLGPAWSTAHMPQHRAAEAAG